MMRSQSASLVAADNIILALASASDTFIRVSAALVSTFPFNHVPAKLAIGPKNACIIV